MRLMTTIAVKLNQSIFALILMHVPGPQCRREHAELKPTLAALIDLTWAKVLGMIEFHSSTILEQRSKLQSGTIRRCRSQLHTVGQRRELVD